MKRLTATVTALLLAAQALGAPSAPTPTANVPVHRYLVERTYPPGALDAMDATFKAQVNTNNARLGVRWVLSYENAARTKTYCVYEGPNEAAIRAAAAASGLPVDSVTEVPLTVLPE